MQTMSAILILCRSLFSITSFSFPQEPMKFFYSHDVYSILVTVVDAKALVEDGRGVLFLLGHKNNLAKWGNPDLTTTIRGK